ncbi:MAG TPA: metallophosphoesterase family protein [Gemmataceae bacterium]|nr:metallophosphoesterase family protein [Gemmataceae bacterium]
MRIAFLSDVHGNAIALDGCLQRARTLGVDTIYFLGDAVGYLPAAREVVDRLEGEGDRILCQQGNHEHMLFSGGATPEREDAYRLTQARQQLDADRLASISSWPIRRELSCGWRKLLLVHGSPSLPLDGYVYPDTDLSTFGDLPYDAVVMGHTHRPFVREHRGKLFVNVGSVGLPRDHGNLAAFALYDDEANAFEIVRVPLDVDAILAAYGDEIHDSVRACLRRK